VLGLVARRSNHCANSGKTSESRAADWSLALFMAGAVSGVTPNYTPFSLVFFRAANKGSPGGGKTAHSQGMRKYLVRDHRFTHKKNSDKDIILGHASEVVHNFLVVVLVLSSFNVYHKTKQR
jgi:hypothetical protein